MTRKLKVCVAGAQVPFMRGGAEQAVENLTVALRDAGHQADLVRLPVAWDAGRILESAAAWRFVAVDADVVIATNFPSYFIRHPHKVVWLFHQHRPLYDAYDMPWSDFTNDDASLELQRLLSDWDTRALEEATARFTLSDLVTDRLRTFNGLSSTTLYHPAPLQSELHSGRYDDYFLCVSRLERNKRVDLALRGFAAAPGNSRFVVAGEGGERGNLEKLAQELGVASRVELRGFVDDDVLIDLFANCRAVIYTPIQEDYGYVTLQAFAAAKPVITVADSGGVLEWVTDGVTGRVVATDPAALGEAVAQLAADAELAQRMGEAGAARANQLTWQPVVETLLASV